MVPMVPVIPSTCDFSTVMMICGDCERELSSHETTYERALEADVVCRLNSILEVCVV